MILISHLKERTGAENLTDINLKERRGNVNLKLVFFLLSFWQDGERVQIICHKSKGGKKTKVNKKDEKHKT